MVYANHSPGVAVNECIKYNSYISCNEPQDEKKICVDKEGLDQHVHSQCLYFPFTEALGIIE